MAKKKIVPINYTSRDFDSIKSDLVDYSKRFYPNRVNDFSKASFASLVLDSVAYAGDILSYYLDYQVNESFLDTSIEFDNIRKHANTLGYKFAGIQNAYGTIAMFVLIPANANGTAPNTSYYPIVKAGTTFQSSGGGSFILTEDVRFDDPQNEVVAARFDPTDGATTFFAVRAYGQVVSGRFETVTFDLSSEPFQRFRKLRVGGTNISEIFSVVDGNGNKYYEVDYLSQETVFIDTTNKNAASDNVRSILKPFVATRRFVVEQNDQGTFMQFGFGSEEDETTGLVDPAKATVKMYGKRYVTDRSFDPTQLMRTNKLGISPGGTTLTVVYKVNDVNSTNVPVNALNTVSSKIIRFDNPDSLTQATRLAVEQSLEVNNDEPISLDTTAITNEELKVRAKNYYAMQNRAVSKQDYESLCYNMPPKYGSIKRANAVNDPSGTNRRLALYLISADTNGYLTTTNEVTKQNLKKWISSYKMLNDVIDIYDTKIINFGIDFQVTVTRDANPTDVVNRVISKMIQDYDFGFYIGEPIYISEISNIISKVDGVSDVKKIKIYNLSGGNYSGTSVNFEDIKSRDGTFYKAPKNAIFELKFPRRDIKGTAR